LGVGGCLLQGHASEKIILNNDRGGKKAAN